MNLFSFYFCIYYNTIIAYSFFYLYKSFSSELAWAKCGEWAGPSTQIKSIKPVMSFCIVY